MFHPYEDILPYESFSLRLTNDDIPNLREILRGVTDEQYRRLVQVGAGTWAARAGPLRELALSVAKWGDPRSLPQPAQCALARGSRRPRRPRRPLQNVVRHAAAFSWYPESGGSAFNYTIATLRRKHMNLKALYYPVFSERDDITAFVR